MTSLGLRSVLPHAVRAILCILILSAAPVLHAFNVSSSFWQRGEVVFNVNFPDRHSSGSPLPANSSSLQALQTEFVRSLNEWTDQSSFKFIVDTSAPAVDPCGPTGNGVQFAPTNCGRAFGSTTLAVQTQFFFGNSRSRTTINFDSGRRWQIFSGFRSGSFDFRRVALHELGHSVGLDHEDDGRATIMTSITTSVRSLQADDLAGADFLYDRDEDGTGFADDNCPIRPNQDQLDTDDDGLGDACDSDIDDDGVLNAAAIDQSFAFDPPSLSNSGFSFGSATFNSGRLAQTFTAGFDGQLEAAYLPVSCDSGAVQVFLRQTDGQGRPVAINLDSTTTTANSNIGGFVEFDFNANSANDVALQAGQQYALVVYASPNGNCFWRSRTGNQLSYPNGEAFFSQDGTNFFRFSGGQPQDQPFAVRVRPANFDNCPLISNPNQLDSDNNGIGDACQTNNTDSDEDTVPDISDNCPNDANTDQLNTDGDAFGDVCDLDDDNDGVNDPDDNCPVNRNANQNDADGDGIGDACDAVFNDRDNDTVADAFDNCPSTSNSDQLDTDNDQQGNACDLDDDNDNVNDVNDNCPLTRNSDQADRDGDSVGDVCDSTFNDMDNDTIADAFDNCPAQSNVSQLDTDNDTFGNVCDNDDDNDTIADDIDNCPLVANSQQADADGNGIGDLCEASAVGGDETCFPIKLRNRGLALICL